MTNSQDGLSPWAKWFFIAAYFCVALLIVIEGLADTQSQSLAVGLGMVSVGVAGLVIGGVRLARAIKHVGHAFEVATKTVGQLVGGLIVLVFILFVLATMLMLALKVIGFAWS